MRFLGIDFGTKNTGLAMSDEEGRMAFPLRTISTSPQLLDEVLAIVKEEKIEGIVIGDSRNFKGEENPVMQKAHKFRTDLERRSSISVHLESELFTTQEAKRLQGETKGLDASSAAIILQSFLDKKANNHE